MLSQMKNQPNFKLMYFILVIGNSMLIKYMNSKLFLSESTGGNSVVIIN